LFPFLPPIQLSLYYNSMKISLSLAAALLLVTTNVPSFSQAFVPEGRGHLPRSWNSRVTTTTTRTTRSMVDGKDTDTDVSIPYDAAARLAYDEWRAKYNKGDFDPIRYQHFQANYETITIANVVAKKQARDNGNDSASPPSLMALNEYGDCTEEEFQALVNMKQQPTSTGDVLGRAVEAAQSQSQASSALEDAANALAEDEEMLAKQLGLESVEELEVALDSLQGIAADGGELESDNLAREARIRSAYLNWCKDYNKEPDESRYPVFANNFLVMEEYATQAGKEMTLNQYADCTEEEYQALQQQTKKTPTPPSSPAPPAAAKVSSSKDASGATESREAAAAKAAEVAKALEKAAREAAARAEEERQRLEAMRKVREEEMRKERAALELKRQQLKEWQAKSEAERRAANEKEKAARQQAQEKELKQTAESFEAEAIAAARRQAQAEAARLAQRRKLDQQAADLARKQAREWEEKQRKLAALKAPAPPKKSPSSVFGSFMAPKKAEQKPAAPPARLELDLSNVFPPKPAPTPAKKPVFDLSALNDLIPPPSAPAPKPQPAAAPKRKAKAAPAKNVLESLFSAPQPAAPKRTAAPKPVPAPAPEMDLSDPVTEAFSSLFGVGSKPAPKISAAKPVVAPKPAPAPSPKPAFSFFGSAPAAAPKKAPAPAPAPAPPVAKPKSDAGIFGIFGAAVPAPTPAKPAPAPAQKKAPAPSPFTFFGGGSPAPAPAPRGRPQMPERVGTVSLFGKPPEPKEIEIPNRPGTLNIFGAGAKTASKKPQPKVPNRGGTISLFGAGSGSDKVAPTAKKSPSKAPAKPAFSFFGGGGGSVTTPKQLPTNIPILSRWKQNPDGSITGLVSNSKNFERGTKITTSPVPKGAKPGSVVTTGSGSQYLLK